MPELPVGKRRLAIAVAVGLAIAAVAVATVLVVAGDEEILVLPQPQAQFEPPGSGDPVQVSGTVIRYEDAAKPRGAEDLEEFSGRNVIVAESVKAPGEPPPKVTGGDPEEVLEGHGDDLLGKEVTVLAEVAGEDPPGPAFTIERPPDAD